MSIKVNPVEGRIFRELDVQEKKVFANFKFVMRVLKTFNVSIAKNVGKVEQVLDQNNEGIGT